MDNQHRAILGYRELSQAEIDLMNTVKTQAVQVEALIEAVRRAGEEIDPRWLAIARTHLQEGFMALTRAITRPSTF